MRPAVSYWLPWQGQNQPPNSPRGWFDLLPPGTQPRCVQMALRWTPDSGQFGGLDKLGPGCRYVASLPSTEVPAWASAGVRPPRAE